jgi:ATP-dependent Clp protease ATP-binding subunit ClpB
MEKHTVSRLIGAPPGYVGYEEGGQLTEAVRRRPYCVILFDEIEKAHHDVFNVLLQILDDGRVTDSHGHVVNFKNAIIIMTSNIGSNHIVEAASGNDEAIKKTVLSELSAHFRPEFLNRVDEIVVFRALTRDNLAAIVGIQLARFAQTLKGQNIGFTADEKAKAFLAKEGFDPIYGARPLKRTIQKLIETPLSRMIVAGELKEGQTIQVGSDGAALKFSVKH